MYEEPESEIQKRILNAARKVFVAKGRAAATMSEIAEEAGISRTSLNYYFRTKDRIFVGIFEETLKDLLPKIGHILDLKNTVLEKFEMIIDAHVEVLLQNREMPFFVLRELNTNPKPVLAMMKSIITRNGLLEKLLNQMKSEYKLKSKAALAGLMMVYSGNMLIPFFGKNMLVGILGNDKDDEFNAFVRGRKKIVLEAVRNFLEGL